MFLTILIASFVFFFETRLDHFDLFLKLLGFHNSFNDTRFWSSCAVDLTFDELVTGRLVSNTNGSDTALEFYNFMKFIFFLYFMKVS